MSAVFLSPPGCCPFPSSAVFARAGARAPRPVVVLRRWHALPDVTEDAGSALSLMRTQVAQGTPYDIAVLDMELAATIAGDPGLRRTRMLLLTSTLQLDTAMFERAGISEWLAKPVRSSELYDRLLRLINPPGSVPAPAAHPRPAGAPSNRAERILVVEDNELNQLVAEGIVGLLGYQVNIVANGLQALEALEALNSTTYAAVLMDCHMPIMDGFEATREIRRRPDPASTIPIIAMTAGAMAEDQQRCLDAGMNDYVTKPIDLQALREGLRNWVRSNPTPRSDEAAIDQQRVAQLRQLGSLQNTDLLATVVYLFISQAPARLAAIRNAVRQQKGDDLTASAHALRGAADNVGATQVGRLCLELERDNTIDQDRALRLTGQLTTDLDVACHALQEALLTGP